MPDDRIQDAYVYETLGGLKADAISAKNQRATIFEKLDEQSKLISTATTELKKAIADSVAPLNDRVTKLENHKIKTQAYAAGAGGTLGFLASQWEHIKNLLSP